MALIKDFHDKLLISVTDGKKLGEVKDVYLDPDITRIVAVYLGKSGIIKRKMLMIELSRVQLLGIDAWFISGSDTVIARDEVEGADAYVLAGDLRGREIQTEGGTKIGSVDDVIVDEKSKVVGFTLDRLQVQGPLAQSRVIARAAITSLGDKHTPMVASLEQAEKLPVLQ
jgi:sporulation protein YlmC with PRC-barrel domain